MSNARSKSTFKRITGLVSSLLGALVLFSLASVFLYWIYAFLYFGGHGDLTGLPEYSLTHLAPLARLGLKDGPLVWAEWRSVGYHLLRTCGPGVFALVPAFVILKLYELIVPH